MVNRGEEKVRVHNNNNNNNNSNNNIRNWPLPIGAFQDHMNVVPRSTMNTNGGTEN